MNKRGFFHVHAILLLLAIVGAWFLYKSYQSGSITQDIATVYDDVISLIERAK